MKQRRPRADDLLTRRSFLKSSSGAVIAMTLPALTLRTGSHQTAVKVLYVCPPCGLDCDKLTFDKPGRCPVCGMTLIEKMESSAPNVQKLMETYKIPGLSLAIVDNFKLASAQAFGVTEAGGSIPVTTIYHLIVRIRTHRFRCQADLHHGSEIPATADSVSIVGNRHIER